MAGFPTIAIVLLGSTARAAPLVRLVDDVDGDGRPDAIELGADGVVRIDATPRGEVRIAPAVTSGRLEVARYRASTFAERAFCPRCGSHLWFNDVEAGGAPQQYELMPGLFDVARAWPLRGEIYVDRALASLRLEGGHRRRTRAEYEADHPFVAGDIE